MDVLVFGATGPLGRCLVDRLLAAGQQVTAPTIATVRSADRWIGSSIRTIMWFSRGTG